MILTVIESTADKHLTCTKQGFTCVLLMKSAELLTLNGCIYNFLSCSWGLCVVKHFTVWINPPKNWWCCCCLLQCFITEL